MKIFTLSLLAIAFGSLPASASQVIYNEDVVQFNPYIVCDDLVDLTNNGGYDDWRNYQLCVKYFKHVDGVQ